MEELLASIWALVHWRLVLSVLGTAVATLTLSNLFVGFTAGYCITLVILSAAFGIYWQSRSEAGMGLATEVAGPSTLRPVALLGLSFVGLILGGLFFELWKSELLAVLSLILSVGVVALWRGAVQRLPVPPRTIAFSTGALLSAILVVLLVVRFKG
jgi:hypothetical protein